MGFLRTLFWIVATVVVVVFSVRNWVPVTISLFANVEADVKLPVLLGIAFLLGFLPLYIWHRAALWRNRRRLAEATAPVAAPTTMPAAAPAAPALEREEPGMGPAQAD